VLLAAATLGLCGSVVFGVAWYRARGVRSLGIESLGEAERRRLTEELMAISPGIFEPALGNPAIGYTLKPGQRVDAWNDTFVANSLGYRSGPVEKAAESVRVVFVGDSWTFGLGVSEAQAFPRQVQDLARDHSGSTRPVEAWSLALPGYNLLNEVAALETFADQLQPDAVVFCPTINDINSSQTVLPNGSLGHAGQVIDDFGCPAALELRSRVFDSHLYRGRWRRAMAVLGESARKFEARGVPSVVFFVGPWTPAFAHALVAEAGIDSPYLVTPPELAAPQWTNPPPWRHPTPAAHQLYARMVYRALAQQLDWAELEASGSVATVAVHRREAGGDRRPRESDEALRRETARQLVDEFVAGSGSRGQLACGIDPVSGVMGRSAAVFLRRRPQSGRLVVRLRRWVESSFVYPLVVKVTVPSEGGGTCTHLVVPDDGPAERDFAVDVPADLGSRAAIDVLLEAERVGLDPKGSVPWSVAVVRVRQAP
jgi:hypothetical protein